MKEYLSIQRNGLLKTYKELLLIDEKTAAVKEAGKWSIKEIMGHLVDSASNNHQRFIRVRMQDNLVFAEYDQDEWVKYGGYQDLQWKIILDCWLNLNLIIIKVILNLPESILKEERTEHNLDQIAWKTVPKTKPASLEYFIKDYYEHLYHHLEQVRKKTVTLQ